MHLQQICKLMYISKFSPRFRLCHWLRNIYIEANWLLNACETLMSNQLWALCFQLLGARKLWMLHCELWDQIKTFLTCVFCWWMHSIWFNLLFIGLMTFSLLWPYASLFLFNTLDGYLCSNWLIVAFSCSYIILQTAALDGETDLKTRVVASACMGIDSELLHKIKVNITSLRLSEIIY